MLDLIIAIAVRLTNLLHSKRRKSVLFLVLVALAGDWLVIHVVQRCPCEGSPLTS
jgi:hypothetical protein